ncbi:MAG TPA: glycerol-3-phosphate dehydrogenase/oxidase [Acidimicrobiales bacterium]|nr:glycerol-3-phosphate dehydrogenase/oxidase [Acidimicrobiales bacterium]
MSLGTFDRSANLARIEAGTYDVLVVGGGITGAGVALDAASRGLRTALVERDDFASGTSSKSSKLVHGGLRYLQNGDIRLVYQALRERQRLLRNAPHLVHVLPFLIPVFSGRDGIIPKQVARALGSAMWLYDLTGGLRIGKVHKRLKRDQALSHMPTLDERLAWAYLYYDAQTDDARLTLAILRTAALDHGAVVVNHARVDGFRKDGDRVTGALVEADGRQFEVKARVVVNAAGVWADDVRAYDEGTHPQSIRPAKGIHITVPWDKVRNDIAAVLPVRKDKRSIFVVPWEGPDGKIGPDGFTYVGTTDTDYDGPVDDPQCTEDDIAYLLDALNSALRTPLDRADVLGTWAGLRPLVREATSGRTADLSRRHRVATSTSGVVTVTGGKLTTYREMAQDTVDAVVERLRDRSPQPLLRRGRTANLQLRGADGWEDERDHDAHLAGRYGNEARVLHAMLDADPGLAGPLVAGLPYRRAEAVYAVRYEMATTLDDVLSRRTRARLLNRDATAAAAEDVAELVGEELGWTDDERARQVATYRQAADRERQPVAP